MRPPWEQYFMGIAHYVSIRSHDEQTKVGCVIVNEDNHVLSMGYNGFPKGVKDDSLPTAISSNELKIYLTHFPCCRCAKLLWQNNIKKWFIEKGKRAVSCSKDDRKVYKLLVENGLQIAEVTTCKDLLLGE